MKGIGFREGRQVGLEELEFKVRRRSSHEPDSLPHLSLDSLRPAEAVE